VKVYYNEKCSVCRFEIEHYKKQNNKDISWVDVTHHFNSTTIKKSKKELVRRMHVEVDGNIYIGVDAFKVLWGRMEKYKFLAKLLDNKIIYKVAHYLYEFIAFFLYLKNRGHINE